MGWEGGGGGGGGGGVGEIYDCAARNLRLKNEERRRESEGVRIL